ncbi:MAG TPA: flagellar basal-body MS-ring/collar protein FliF [Bacillales bacterium]|nr:flagellar basal-body MS-ring/collar protein FliF [Bacillales bacterium]
MKEILAQYKEKGLRLWNGQSRFTKGVIAGGAGLVLLAVILMVWLSKPNFVPLYSNLSAEETGQIKQTLEEKGVPAQISDGGSTISVPKNLVDTLKVELAAEGIPDSGHIDYTFFGKNASWGMTDNEFNVIKQEAMQTELSRLITTISGVKGAKVMISLPQQSVWVSDENQSASASVVLELDPGYRMKAEQVNALYHLVSKSVPNLPIENIVIMDQMFNYFEPAGSSSGNAAMSAYQQQREIKQSIEEDLQRQVQKMLGMMMGMDNVVVSVTTDIDFTREKDVKKLVKPVDKEDMEGLQASVEKIRETYSGKGNNAGGVAGTGSSDVPNYVANSGSGNSEYTHTEERINNVFNEIHKTIEKSPYSIRDIGIQVMVAPPDPKDPASLPQSRVNDIKNILGTMIRTTLPKDGGSPLTKQEISDKIYVSVQPFGGRVDIPEGGGNEVPLWYYVIGGVLLLVILLLLLLLMKKRRTPDEPIVREEPKPSGEVPEMEAGTDDENTIRRKQLEKLAKEKPDQFAKLLRSWISDE